ncbi:hypoxanthine phosphoribosyltransferase [Sneathia sanguinegens]|jgi:hypothetical protein|uniref:hypoxanthine phosphoribosyltransferase n=1 Tax=Sneathia sanguinegens TaxID=40543 RepID=UPI0008308DFC|nr:hypoxanthine phosphoribosyltransferase [Sneathia sanguinegens]MDU4652262.1 hypoxanthine phosphoribosyltransferase [Sneathia sanguinegens]MDU7496684.1 hypoxanthine phosphoribosyltransferase [Sneathia sanguinegens]
MSRNWEEHIVKTLISKEEISKRVKELGAEITKDYINDDAPFVVVGILKGSVVFMSDLVREIHLPLTMDFMEVSSYGNDFETSREIKIIKDLEHSVRGKNVLVVEDIIDSGLTLKKILKMIGKREPKKVILCTLLNKEERRQTDVDVQYIGFDIPDEFVSGYGLDYMQEYRNIPYICVLDVNKDE